jgi:hypothetical protein
MLEDDTEYKKILEDAKAMVKDLITQKSENKNPLNKP